MDYNLLICASVNNWMAIDVDADGNCDRVSFDGNEIVEVLSVESIDYFCSRILDYYNIDNFYDIALNVKVVVVGNYSNLITELFMRMKVVKDINIIDVKSIIPIFVLKNCVVKKGGIIDIKCMDKDFTLQVDDNLIVSFSSEKVGESIAMIPEKFSMLFRFDCNNLISNESELKELESKYISDVQEKQKEIDKQKKLYDELLKKYRKLVLSNADLQKQIRNQNTKFNDKRLLIRFTVEHLKQSKQSKGLYLDRILSLSTLLDGETKYICKLLKADGDIVKKNSHLLEVIEIKVSSGNEPLETGRKCVIKADSDGRVLFSKE